MKMQKCFNGHYYNTVLFSICPFCNKQNQKVQIPLPAPPPPSESEEILGHTIIINQPQEFNQENRFTAVPPLQTELPVPQPPKSALANEIKGCTIYRNPSQAKPQHPSEPVFPPFYPVDLPSFPVDQSAEPAFPSPPIMDSDPPQPTPAASGEKTKILYGDVEPVVGWLICLKGAYVGESFPLKTGQNFIGRSVQMDVPLLDEESVSRDTHAMILFEPGKSEFFASNGTGRSMTYLNHEILMQPTRLKAYDVLRFGECEYLFMPLCSEQFSWDTYLEK